MTKEQATVQRELTEEIRRTYNEMLICVSKNNRMRALALNDTAAKLEILKNQTNQ